jgi:formylglycine-generating enzyme required for sulfatase activity
MKRRNLIVLGLGIGSGMTSAMGVPSPSIAQPKFLGLPVQPYRFTTVKTTFSGNSVRITPTPGNSKTLKYIETSLTLSPVALPLEMVAIRGGSFQMGITSSERNLIIKNRGQPHYNRFYSDEEPQHSVKIPDFYMGRYGVTQAQYQAVMGTNPSFFKGMNLPVESVHWEDAQEFIRRLREMTGLRYRLPTEAEWEFTARSGTTTRFSFGDVISPAVVNCRFPPEPGIKLEKEKQATIKVSDLYPNFWGLYQMHGNVYEWCEDQYYNSYQFKPQALTVNGSIPWTQEITNMPPSKNPNFRILRGGSWNVLSRNSRLACRYGLHKECRSNGNGFRLALSLR